MRGRPRKKRKRDMKILKKRRGLFEGSLWRRGVQPPPQRVEKVAKGHFFEFFQRFSLTIAPGRQTLQRAKP